MAVLDVTKKAAIYHTLHQLNSAFAEIVGCYQRFRETGVLTTKSTRLHQGMAQEAQSGFNQEFLPALGNIEADDWSRFGKVRFAMEDSIRDPDDVFLQAEERRAELNRQRKKIKQPPQTEKIKQPPQTAKKKT